MSSVDDFIVSERVVEISTRCHIGYENGSIRVESKENGGVSRIPIGDLLAVLIESETSTVTSAALAACGEKGVAVIACRRHLPIALSLPVAGGWNAAERRRQQAHALRGEAAGRRLWRRTVRAKIAAQANLVEATGNSVGRRMRRMADQVDLDGQETIEAQVASIYWRSLFPLFERSDDVDPRNALLNWGYAVLLATFGRALVSHGFDPSLGFGHSSRTNPWALASDLMEPFRPTVDAAVLTRARSKENIDPSDVKNEILRPFANDGPVKKAVLEVVRGYREFLDDGNETNVRYPDGPLAA